MLTEKPWRVDKVLLFCAAVLFCLCLGATTVGLLHQWKVPGFQEEHDAGGLLVGTFFFQGIVCVLILVFLRQHQVDWRDAFGLHDPGLKRAIYLGVIAAAIIVPVTWRLQYVMIELIKMLSGSPEDPPVQNVVQAIKDTRLVWMQVYLGVFAVGVAPIAEEFIFRGMLYPLSKRLGFPRLGCISVSLLFALTHLSAPAFVPLFLLALAFTWLYERTDNLLAPIVAHALFNAVNFAYLIFRPSQ